MQVVVIGSGIAGVTFAESLRQARPDDSVVLLTRDSHGYYSRPLLSHTFSRPDIETKIVLKSFAALRSAGIDVRELADVLRIDPEEHSVHVSVAGSQQVLTFDTLVLAPGSDALIPPPFRDCTDVFSVLNSFDDLLKLRRLREELQDSGATAPWAVIGGGLIGCEIAADLAVAGEPVSLFHALPRLMERQLVEADSAALLNHLTDSLKIDVRLDQAVTGFGGTPGRRTIRFADAEIGEFRAIIVACGFKPRIELARDAGLACGRGIRVDGRFRTSVADIYALGDAAELPDGKLYAYVTPVRSQALWLGQHGLDESEETWPVPAFKPKAKIPGFNAAFPYQF